MISFFIGFFIGGFVGFTAAAIIIAVGVEDHKKDR